MTMILQGILSESRDFLRSYGEVPSQTLLYVNQKLTCEFSPQASGRLSNKDLILMQILIESQFRRSKSTKNKGGGTFGKRSVSDTDANNIQEEDDADYYGDSESEYESEATTASPARSTPPKQSRESIDLGLDAILDDMPMSPLSYSSISSSFLLFLESCPHMYSSPSRTPSCVRIIEMNESVLAVIVSELSSRFISRSIHLVLSILNKVLFCRQDFQGVSDLHDFNKAVDHLQQILERKSSSPTPFCSRHPASTCLSSSPSTPRSHLLSLNRHSRHHSSPGPPSPTSRQTLQMLKDLVTLDVRKYCNSFNRVELPARIDALCSSVCASLRALYNEAVFSFELNRMTRIQSLEQVRCHLLSIQSFALEQSALYLEYLTVKAQVNMTVDPYVSIIPGLKAFLYTDRKTNVIAYAFSDSKGKELLSPALQSCFLGLMEGKLSLCLQIKDLMVFYFVWFEDIRGNTLTPTAANVSLPFFPCLMNYNHLTRLRDECFPCKRRDSLCLGRETVSCHEILVMVKSSSLSSYLSSPTSLSASSSSSSSSSLPNTSLLITDMEPKCKRIAGRLQELLLPDHYFY